MYEDMPCVHRILHVGKNSEEPLMMIIALMLALVEKPKTTCTWLEYVADADECD